MATVLHEPAFQSVSHEGRDLSIHMRGAGEDGLVLVVFDRGTTPTVNEQARRLMDGSARRWKRP